MGLSLIHILSGAGGADPCSAAQAADPGGARPNAGAQRRALFDLGRSLGVLYDQGDIGPACDQNGE